MLEIPNSVFTIELEFRGTEFDFFFQKTIITNEHTPGYSRATEGAERV